VRESRSLDRPSRAAASTTCSAADGYLRGQNVATGFLFGYERQLDILVYDRVDSAPLFREGDLVVVAGDAVRAVIEVKSKLNHTLLREALGVLHYIDDHVGERPPIFKGIFAYSTEMTTSSILQTMTDFYDLENDDPETMAMLSSLTQIVSAVCVQKQSIILSDFTEIDVDGGMFVPRLYSVENSLERTHQAAIFFEDLKRHLRRPDEAIASGPEFSWFISSELERGEVRNVYDRDWGPYYLKDDASDVEATVRAEAEAIRRWRRGERWVPPDPSARKDPLS
jgi:hypothetical protein